MKSKQSSHKNWSKKKKIKKIQNHLSNWKYNEKYISNTTSIMMDDVINLINDAKSFIVVSSFFLAHTSVENALFEASKRNVRCYLMFASNIRLQQEQSDDEFDKKTYNRHIETLKKLSGKTLIHSSINFHAKIILCDPITNPKGMLLTANFTEEALGRNQELAVNLTKEEIEESLKIIKWAFWEYANNEIVDDKGNFLAYKPIKKISEYKGIKNILQTTPTHKTIKNGLMNAINDNSRSMIISSYGWEDNFIVDKLCDMSKHGTDITVLARPRPQYITLFTKMKKSGIRILGYKWLHAKAIVTDKQVIVMSSNIEKFGLDKGFEMGIKIDGSRANTIRDILKQWCEGFQYEFLLSNDKNC